MRNKQLILASAIVLAQASLAQVRTSTDAFPLKPLAEALPVLPFTPAHAPALTGEVSLVLQKGRPVMDGLRAYGQKTGWDLVWEAPAYVAERDMVVPGDFEAAVESFLKGANEAGTRIRAVFYRGNKTVRVSEY